MHSGNNGVVMEWIPRPTTSNCITPSLRYQLSTGPVRARKRRRTIWEINEIEVQYAGGVSDIDKSETTVRNLGRTWI